LNGRTATPAVVGRRERGSLSARLSGRGLAGVALALCVLAGLTQTGCAVPQPRGDGRLQRIVEPRSSRGYWLYLPSEYVKCTEAERRARRWPTVVTFHGMKPFDNAHPQAREWQQEADRYGYVVVAPELRAPDVFAEFPLRSVTPAFRSDEAATLAILDHVFAHTAADPGNVLATSWSSGGYMAHYMMNQYPDRFTCLAVRQSNFSPYVLNEALVPRSRQHPVLIVNTQNDFDVCKRESREAVAWYSRHGFRYVAWVYIKNLGHERTPDLAADFFARIAGVEPNRPPEVLVQRQAIDGNAEGMAFLSGRMALPRRATPTAAAPAPAAERPVAASTTGVAAARRPNVRPEVAIRVSTAIGIEPLHLGYWAVCPADWYQSASFQWTLNGEPIGNSVNGQRTIGQAGEHTLGLLIVTRDNQEFRAARTVRVLPQVRSAGFVGE